MLHCNYFTKTCQYGYNVRMPQKTKKEKLKIQERKEEMKVKASLADSKQENTHYFVQDMRRSLLLVAVILVVEVGIYLAATAKLLLFIPQA